MLDVATSAIFSDHQIEIVESRIDQQVSEDWFYDFCPF